MTLGSTSLLLDSNTRMRSPHTGHMGTAIHSENIGEDRWCYSNGMAGVGE